MERKQVDRCLKLQTNEVDLEKTQVSLKYVNPQEPKSL